MSFGIVRVQKFKAADVKGIQIHDHRERPSRTNPDIDKERTPQNYSLVQSENWNEAIKARTETLESTKAVRKDAVVMVQILVTSDHEFFKGLTPEKEKAFFEQSLKFIQDRYGKENVFSAVVHKDERTPHMHVNLTPIRNRRLTAKEIFNRKDVTSLHTDFHASVGKEWGLKRGESREEKRKHLDTEAFKLQTKKEQLLERMEEMKQNGIWLKPEDVEPKVLKKSLLSTTVEAPEVVAKRLNESFIAPMVEKTNASIRAANDLRKENDGLRQDYQQERQARLAIVDKYRDFHGLSPEQFGAVKGKALEFKAINEAEAEKRAIERQKEEAQRLQAMKDAEARRKLELDLDRALRNTPGTVGKHMEQAKEIMAQYDKAPDKKAFEKALRQQFPKERGMER